METFVAIDIGASSGRVIKSERLDGKLTLEEIHRFKNAFHLEKGFQRWNVKNLIQEILIGLEKLKRKGIQKCFVGIDTWAVDYCLVDKNGELLANPVSYRDPRTQGAIDLFQQKMDLITLFKKTGIQIQPFNTIFQLLIEDKRVLEATEKIMLIPDYLGYMFTDEMVTEKTNGSTMQLLNNETETWDEELLQLLGINEEFFAPLVDSGTILGPLVSEKFTEFDLPEVTFINVASHDTASAVAGIPSEERKNWGFLSSGTWSLLGVETKVSNHSVEAYNENYSNEWGVESSYRFLKNIMGMWLIQQVSHQLDDQYSYQELADLASEEPKFQQFIDINEAMFLNPENMIEAIQDYCRKTDQKIPKTTGEIARSIFDNLALCYALELEKLEKLSTKIEVLHIIGGGSNNELLNQLTADLSHTPVCAGPSEATAIGNILIQMVTIGIFSSVQEGRDYVRKSFPQTYYQPIDVNKEVLENYKCFIEKRKNNDN
ncbi:rhamnulokinase [Enterococcus sp. AZ192]|uniref:rhamnulokinase n=1 Tax=unclassified Enterococcus TaxID=2608891 RepID=UPI003D2C59F9